jgi:hypothetical protein
MKLCYKEAKEEMGKVYTGSTDYMKKKTGKISNPLNESAKEVPGITKIEVSKIVPGKMEY